MLSQYSILSNWKTSPPEDIRVLSYLPDLRGFEGQPVAFDYETHGINPRTGSIRSVAISNDHGTVAIDMEVLSKRDCILLTNWLVRQRLIAHNAVFDIGWLYHHSGRMPRIEACTLVLFKQLSTEGFLGQRWGLKNAMTEILGWDESNEEDLYAWLKQNKLKKGDMAQAPWDILGKYNALDAAATWQLYKGLLEVCEKRGWLQSIMQFHRTDVCCLIRLTVEQQMAGMTIDLPAVVSCAESLDGRITAKRDQFLDDPAVSEHVGYFQSVIIRDIRKVMPPVFSKTGKITVRFKKWWVKLSKAKRSRYFNIDSILQLRWLIYERLGYECPLTTVSGLPSVGKKAFPHFGHLGVYLKEYRELRDRRKFVSALENVQVDGLFHPSVRVHGTITGRSSGGAPE